MGFKCEELASFTHKESRKDAISEAVFDLVSLEPFSPEVMLQICRGTRKDGATGIVEDTETIVDSAVEGRLGQLPNDHTAAVAVAIFLTELG